MKQTIKPCYFASGTCINCDATERGACEGWVCSPERPWVGLTDEEIDKWTPEIHVVIRAVEQLLMERNL